jgi:cytosine deaminase
MTDVSVNAQRLGNMLDVAYNQALESYAYVDSLGRHGVPIGAALFTRDGILLGKGHNQMIQRDDPATHAETDAFRNAYHNRGSWPAGATFGDAIFVTTLSPCLFCCGLIRRFGLGTEGGAVVIGENTNYLGGESELEDAGVALIRMDDERCKTLLGSHIREYPEVWND